jgi:hypothetical protein
VSQSLSCPILSSAPLTTADKKAIAMGLVFSAGNAGGIIASEAYQSSTAPQFRPGHGTALGFLVICFLSALTLYIALKRENERRDSVYGPAPGSEDVNEWEDPEFIRKWGLEGMSRKEIVALGDDHPGFRYIL